MKKNLMTFLVMSVVAGVFADPYKIPAEDIEYKTFNEVQYVTEYVSEFNSQEDFERKFLPNSDLVRKQMRGLAVRTEPPSYASYESKENYGPKDKFHVGFKFDEAFTVKDGVLGLNAYAYREKNKVGGYDYHVLDTEINSGSWWWNVQGGVREPEEGYMMHLDGKKMFEMKFKVPRSVFAFEVFFITKDNMFEAKTDINKYRTSKGEYVDEIDMMELTTDKSTLETPKNYISPRGIIETTENGKYAFNSLTIYDKPGDWSTFNRPTYIKNTEKWCNEWHTLNVELTPTSMVCYLDGKKYKSLSWKKKLGEIPPEQEWNLRIMPKSFDCWTNSIDWDNGEYGTFYIDYIKVYKESK